jgi:hypothetical protein
VGWCLILYRTGVRIPSNTSYQGEEDEGKTGKAASKDSPIHILNGGYWRRLFHYLIS